MLCGGIVIFGTHTSFTLATSSGKHIATVCCLSVCLSVHLDLRILKLTAPHEASKRNVLARFPDELNRKTNLIHSAVLKLWAQFTIIGYNTGAISVKIIKQSLQLNNHIDIPLSGLSLPTLVFIAQAVFLSEHGQTHKTTDVTDHLLRASAIPPALVIMIQQLKFSRILWPWLLKDHCKFCISTQLGEPSCIRT